MTDGEKYSAARLRDFWNAWHRSQACVGTERHEHRQAIFSEHIIAAQERPTSPEAQACVEREGVARPLALKREVRP